MKNPQRWFNAFLVFSLILTACAGSEIAATAKPASPTQTVKAYVEYARNGKFDELKKLTTAKDEEGSVTSSAKPRANASDSPTVASDPNLGKQVSLGWIQDEFPKSILDGKLAVTSVRKEKIDGGMAVVEATVEGTDRPNVLGWAFLLSKGADGKWKIYDITTPGGVKD